MNKTQPQTRENWDDSIWRKIIGAKLICSHCQNRDPLRFSFRVEEWGETTVFIRCTKCQHEGDYQPTDKEVFKYGSESDRTGIVRYEKLNRPMEGNYALEA